MFAEILGPDLIIVFIVLVLPLAAVVALVVLLVRSTARKTSGQGPGAWHPDPSGRHQLRYWDGQRWTDHVSDGGRSGVDPLGDPRPT